MGGASVKLDVSGLDDMIREIKKAGGDINSACRKAIKEAADIVDTNIRGVGKGKQVSSRLMDDMPPPEISQKNNIHIAKVGFKSEGGYQPDNLSDYFKALFINYGTPRINPAREFITIAKHYSVPQVRRAEEEAFERILKNLKE